MVLMAALNRPISLFKVLLNDSDHTLLHLLLEDMVLALGIDFVEELLLHFLELFSDFCFSQGRVLRLKVSQRLFEVGEKLLGQRLYCQGNLPVSYTHLTLPTTLRV